MLVIDVGRRHNWGKSVAIGRRSVLIVCALSALGSGCATTRRTPQIEQIVAVEREFAAAAAGIGWVEAFAQYAAPDAVMARDTIVGVGEALTGRPPGDRSLFWWPAFAGISASEDLGFTTGSFSVGPERRPRGQYFTVWRRQPNGAWRWTYDGGPGSVLDPLDENSAAENLRQLPLGRAGVGADAAASAVRSLEVSIANSGALADHLALDARVYRRGRYRAEGGNVSVENTRTPGADVTYDLVRLESSQAGDLVFTLGHARWHDATGLRGGFFARIWQLRSEGWRIVYDQLVERPPA